MTLAKSLTGAVSSGGAVCASVVYAYRRTGQPCLVCGAPIAHAEVRTRNLFWCPGCQAGGSARPLTER